MHALPERWIERRDPLLLNRIVPAHSGKQKKLGSVKYLLIQKYNQKRLKKSPHKIRVYMGIRLKKYINIIFRVLRSGATI